MAQGRGNRGSWVCIEECVIPRDFQDEVGHVVTEILVTASKVLKAKCHDIVIYSQMVQKSILYR